MAQSYDARRRRRRRRRDKPAISAHLLLDERMKGDVGVITEDLFCDLFPGYSVSADAQSLAALQGKIFHVAITPWMPSGITSPSSSPWTILPVRPPLTPDMVPREPHSAIQFPAHAPTLQSFQQAMNTLCPSRIPHRRDAAIEIRVLDVVPLALDAVYVTLDTEGLRKLDEVQQQFGGGFRTFPLKSPIGRKEPPAKYPTRAEQAATQERAWKNSVRDALKIPHVVHTGDLLPLPLPSHPITHVPPPPAKISACEPVSQGIILPSTRIVIVKSRNSTISNAKAARVSTPLSPKPFVNGIPEEGEDSDPEHEQRQISEGEDTSNEQFYSAAEDRNSPTDEDTLDSELEHSDSDLSDGSDDVIQLHTPTLPPQSSGVLSAFSVATPRANARTNGISTPGSIISSFTAGTARPGGPRGKLFKPHGLMSKIPDELLYPKPSSSSDDEARVFVDTHALVRIGCFAGDWVRIESSSDNPNFPRGILGAFGRDEEPEEFEWRTVRVYGLPEHMAKKRGANAGHSEREHHPRGMMTFPGLFPPPTAPAVYASPILLSNLGDPKYLRIAPLMAHHVPSERASVIGRPGTNRKVPPSASPPLAKEVTLLKVATPLSTDRSMQPSLFSGLKEYFEGKTRIVKTGDLVGIAVDEKLGKAVFQPASGASEDSVTDELLSKVKTGSENARKGVGIAWFKVGNVVPASSKVEGEEELWGGVTCVDASNTKMVQAGTEISKIPATLPASPLAASTTSTWPYYLSALPSPQPIYSTSTRGLPLLAPPTPQIPALRRRLRELLAASTSPRAIALDIPPLAILLTSTQRSIGKATLATRAAADLGLHVFPIDAWDILTEATAGGGDVKSEGVLRARADRAVACGAESTVLLIRHIDALTAERMRGALEDVKSSVRVLVATTTDVEKVPEGIRGIFSHEIEIGAPDEGEREGILRQVVEERGLRLAAEVDLRSVAVRTAALVAGDLVDVVERAGVARGRRIAVVVDEGKKVLEASNGSQTIITPMDVELSGGAASVSLTKADFDAAVDAARKNFADSIGAPKIPNVTWDDVGGLSHVKSAVLETISLPLQRPELFAKGLKKRSGILFYGPPGTGKTLLAKAIATEFSLNFFSVKGPELLNMYIGESEANVRRVFQRARDARPCVVFFDELDSVAPKRGNQGDSGGVMDRIVSQLLAELDGMSEGEEGAGGVFVIGATNRPDLLDQALLRPGRFDKMIYLGISDTHEKQAMVMGALTRKFALNPSVSLARVTSTLPFNYTGADLYALCSDAMLKAITRQAFHVDEKVAAINALAAQEDDRMGKPKPKTTIAQFFDHYATPEDMAVMVTEEDFEGAKRELVPSVSVEELGHYERVRRAFEGAPKVQSNGKLHASPSAGDVRSHGATNSISANHAGPHDSRSNSSGPGSPTLTHHTPATSGSNQKKPDGVQRMFRRIVSVSGKQRRLSKGKGSSKNLSALAEGPVHTPDGSAVSEASYQDDERSSQRTDEPYDEDEFVIRTDHLKGSNGSVNGSGIMKGKGRRGSSVSERGFTDAAGNDEEELYS
ncbi:AAA-domain-containing protein [Eremomyces bilateralis CBS 781.70]|uniref:Peroxisomal ATPase PEX6 n=1 Tax=Eremomyces bilateralis CBS 781.70 TaxID=1392243 RepID=A0A6G1FXP4_9PEZI|nr:AAA-domain-containing protein [Eremomyces bilateralis CBS 781.70]KAF1810665.1 AAA-domain-containing protein [Eremomyces bilateralis CBS 781.70]